MDAKRRMGEAMGRLLTKKPLKLISVAELVRESGVTRDAYEEAFASMTDLAHYEFLHILAVHGRDILGSKSWSEALYKKFLMYKKYEGFFRHLYESDDNEHFRRTNRRFVRDAYTMMLRHYGVDVHDPHIQFAVEMVVYGGEEMTMRWMMDGMKVPIEVMLVLFQESIPVSISQYFY